MAGCQDQEFKGSSRNVCPALSSSLINVNSGKYLAITSAEKRDLSGCLTDVLCMDNWGLDLLASRVALPGGAQESVCVKIRQTFSDLDKRVGWTHMGLLKVK